MPPQHSISKTKYLNYLDAISTLETYLWEQWKLAHSQSQIVCLTSLVQIWKKKMFFLFLEQIPKA